MLLTIDAGNTNITFAIFEGDTPIVDWRVSTEHRRTADEYAALIYVILKGYNLGFGDINGVAISSVVPEVTDQIIKFAKVHLEIDDPVILTSNLNLGIKIKYNPTTDVGADRLANAIAGHKKYEGSLIVVDFGTATTLDAISADGVYLGGAIAPGIQISIDALLQRASQLKGIRMIAPEKAIGDSTVGSLQSGFVFGYAGMVDALVERFKKEMDESAKVIATGGLAEVISPHSKTIELVDNLLTLEGLKNIYKMIKV
ncbi:MAG: type III pantothenate kinase [Armatimonadota bacterium]